MTRNEEITDASDADTADFPIQKTSADRLSADDRQQPLHVVVGALSHCGKVRSNNQDHFAVVRRTRTSDVLLSNIPLHDLQRIEEHAHALIVADGMGGHSHGELASRIAIQAIWDLAPQLTKWIMKLNQYELEETRQRIDAYAHYVQRRLREQATADRRLSVMGTTLTTAYVMDRDAIIANVGDSRAYLLRGGTAIQVTRDHTVAQELIDHGVPATEVQSFRARLTRCFASDGDDVTADVFHVVLRPDDGLLLCTDGLTNMISDSEIASIAGSHQDVQTTCQVLVEAALEKGGTDNVTVVMLRVTKDYADSSSSAA